MGIASFVFFVGAILSPLFFTGCADLRKALDPSINYERDLRIEIEFCKKEKKCEGKIKLKGFGVVKRYPLYKITVKAPGKIDLFTATTCHREWKVSNPNISWLTKGYTFYYKPVPGIEDIKYCPLELGVYERNKGRHGWGLIDFNSYQEKLPAILKCNGAVKEYKGVSVCQSKYGLIQAIQFKVKVDFETFKGCAKLITKNYKYFEFEMPKGDCVVYFAKWDDETQIHRLTLYGYDIIPINRGKRYNDNDDSAISDLFNWENDF